MRWNILVGCIISICKHGWWTRSLAKMLITVHCLQYYSPMLKCSMTMVIRKDDITDTVQ